MDTKIQLPTQAEVEAEGFEAVPVSDAPAVPSSVTIVDPNSDAGQRIIRNSAFEQPLTQGDPPPPPVKAYWEVTAGIFHGDVDPTYTRRFDLTAEEIATPGVYIEQMFAVFGYVAELQLQAASGRMPNAILVEFCWL